MDRLQLLGVPRPPEGQNPSLGSPPPHSVLAMFSETKPRSTYPGFLMPGPNVHPYQACPLLKHHTQILGASKL